MFEEVDWESGKHGGEYEIKVSELRKACMNFELMGT